MLVQGHHGGLKSPTYLGNWLKEHAHDPAVAAALSTAQKAMPDMLPDTDVELPARVQTDALAAEIFLRLLFSALVDADYLDTEYHFRIATAGHRSRTPNIEGLWLNFERDQAARFRDAPATLVNQVRREIYQLCLAAAEKPPGLFRLAVPTGGGKTRSAMAFALRHALANNLRRVIVAVPYISITEQTADVYRGIFDGGTGGEPAVLEHHSEAMSTLGDDDDFHPGRVWSRLAAENWDAPIVVTTTVQLFESLFSASTSRSRKLHRLAKSVIILDEAQALPPHLLQPILDALRGLCLHFGTSVVISTATQPAFHSIPAFAQVPADDIVPSPERFFLRLKRVDYEWRLDEPVTWEEVAEWMGEGKKALAVLNTKNDALSVFDALGDAEALYLSTRLCGAHRRRVLAEVKRRLQAGERCRLVSTQLVEAGVDLDFPLVLRALGPLDGIIQAAGRCNREGRLERGRVVIFRPAGGGLPPGAYRTATGITGALAGRGYIDPDDPTVSAAYFRDLFSTVDLDREGIQKLRARLDYPEVAKRFRMIEDTDSVVVQFGSENERRRILRLVAKLRSGAPESRLLMRRLQPYVVSVRSRESDEFRRMGLVNEIRPGVNEWLGGYDDVRGLAVDGPSLIV